MANQLLNRPKLPLPLAVLLLAFLLLVPNLLLLKLQLNNAPEVYFPPNAPSMKFERSLREEFPSDKLLIVLLGGKGIYTTETLSSLDKAISEIRKFSLVERVLSVTSVDHIEASADGFAVSPLLSPSDGLTPSQRRTRVLNDRFAPGFLVSHDGNEISLIVRPHTIDDSRQDVELVSVVKAALAKAGLEGRIKAVAGEVALEAVQLHAFTRGLMVFVPVTTLVGLFLIWMLYRRWLAVVIGGMAMGAASSASMSFIVLLGRPFTLVDSMIPSLITALTVALLIHFYSALQHASLRGWTGLERVSRALHEVKRAARFTSLTTAAGLASLATSPIHTIKYFGLVSAAGVFVLYFVVMVLIPPILAHWDRHPWPVRNLGAAWVGKGVEWLAALGIRYPVHVLIITLLVLAAGMPLLWKVHAETDVYRFFPPDDPIIRDTHRVEDALSGIAVLEVVFDGKGRDALKKSAALRSILDFEKWASKQPEVDHVLSMPDLVEEMNWAFHNENPAYRKLPADNKLISQYLFIYDGRDLFDLVNQEFNRTRVTINLNVHGANEIQHVIDRMSAYLAQANLHGLSWHIAGLGRLYADQEQLMIQGQIYSLWSALILMFVLMAVLWRSTWASFICMIPNIAPIAVVFMVMGLLGIWLDMATAMIASVAVGIAVDDTIHVYQSYAARRAHGASAVQALARTYHVVGRAVLSTSLILGAQFFILSASEFVPIAEFGLLMGIAILAALVFDLLFLPALLMVTARWRERL